MARARITHQTTIRFGEELWQQLELAAERHEMSVAQYVREAARQRLQGEVAELPARNLGPELDQVRQRSLEEAESTAALWQQGRLARKRAQMLRDQAREQRDQRGTRRS